MSYPTPGADLRSANRMLRLGLAVWLAFVVAMVAEWVGR